MGFVPLMKKPLAILLLLFSPSFLFSQLGFGVGFGSTGISLGSVMMLKYTDSQKFVTHIATTDSRDLGPTYDFNPDVFGDSDRGRAQSSIWFSMGIVKKVEDIKFISNKSPISSLSLAGGISMMDEFYVRYDKSELLSDYGTYYVTDDSKSRVLPTVTFGMYFDFRKDKREEEDEYLYRFRVKDPRPQLALTLNLVPFDIGLAYFFFD